MVTMQSGQLAASQLSHLRIAVCEAGEFSAHTDGGGRAVADIVDGLMRAGAETRFISENSGNLIIHLKEFSPDLIIVSRPGLFSRKYSEFAQFNVPLIYFAHDLHFVRIGLGESIHGQTPRAAVVMRMVEEFCFTHATLTLLPTSEEAELVAHEFPPSRALGINYFFIEDKPRITRPSDAPHLIFVGGSLHSPNYDGVLWFLDNVWPRVLAEFPESTLRVCGEWTESSLPKSAIPHVTFVGHVTEEQLREELTSSTIGIAPLRFGAGMKRKTLGYLEHGLPTISTSFGVQGFVDSSGNTPGVVHAQSPEEWIAAVRLLSTDHSEWETLSRQGYDFAHLNFSIERHTRDITRAITRAMES